MSDEGGLGARANAVAVVAEVLVREIGHPSWCDYATKVPEGCTRDFGCDVWRRVDQLAEAVVAALTNPDGPEKDADRSQGPSCAPQGATSADRAVEWTYDGPAVRPSDDEEERA